MNVSNVLEIPDNQDVTVKSINGKGEIGADTDGTGIFLMVNGKLVITDGSKEAVKSYYHIMVNGKALVPKSYEGCFSNIQVNGKTECYPDGATIIKADTEKMIEKKLKFVAKKIVIVKSMVTKLISMFDEETKIVQVPDGTKLINDDVELKTKTIRKYGTKLCVCGDVSIQDAEALDSLEYLFADGTVSVNKELEDAFDEIDSVHNRLKVIDPELGYITDRPMVKLGTALLKKYPKGVQIEDCATVRLSKELSAEDIIEKLHISDCAVVVCTKEQEESVGVIAEDVVD